MILIYCKKIKINHIFFYNFLFLLKLINIFFISYFYLFFYYNKYTFNKTKLSIISKHSNLSFYKKNFLSIFFFYTYSLTYKFNFSIEFSALRSLLIKQFTDYNVLEKSINANALLNNKILHISLKLMKPKNKRKYKILYFLEVVELFFISFKVKVLSSIIIWIKRYFEYNHFKKHKLFIGFVFMILKYLIWYNKLHLNIVGLRCFFKGKLGRGGSVRKNKIELSLGKNSYSAKSIKLIHKKSIIWTKSGSVGFGLELFYN